MRHSLSLLLFIRAFILFPLFFPLRSCTNDIHADTQTHSAAATQHIPVLRELLSFKTTLEALFITCFVVSYYFLFGYFSLHFCACVESSILPCYEKISWLLLLLTTPSVTRMLLDYWTTFGTPPSHSYVPLYTGRRKWLMSNTPQHKLDGRYFRTPPPTAKALKILASRHHNFLGNVYSRQLFRFFKRGLMDTGENKRKNFFYFKKDFHWVLISSASTLNIPAASIYPHTRERE
jgi:hypothetical protein